jgi:hypothetical protein
MNPRSALDAARRARQAMRELEDALSNVLEARGDDGPSDDDVDPVIESCEIALDELHGADSAVDRIIERLEAVSSD